MFAAGRKMGQVHAEQAAAQAEANRQEGAKAAIQQQEQAKAGAAQAETNVTAELQKLAGLHSSGVLSDEEFAAAKKKLLGL
jgi:hypothetical protein